MADKNKNVDKVTTSTVPTNGNTPPSATPSPTAVSVPTTDPQTAYTSGELDALYKQYGVDQDYYNSYYTKGGYTQDLQESITHGGTTTPEKYFDGSDGWYHYDSAERDHYSDNPDATFLSGAAYELTTRLKDEWHALNALKKEALAAGNTELAAQYQTQMDDRHVQAEKIRAGAGYSAGADGTEYNPIVKDNGGNQYEDYSDSYSSGSSSSAGTSSDLKGLLDAWQEAALKQSDSKIDYAVAKAVADLERALADAQPQFKEQAESVDRSARQAMDNSALYAEMRGDKGGIGQEQYNAIQNTQAQNHLTVQQAQTKLATDTQRQIADLRAQGEFEKADAALQITQQYLQQLIGLEQWAAEYNLSVDQFNESVRQWETEYNMAMQQLQISQNQWQAEFNTAQSQWQQQFDYGKQLDSTNQLSGMGEALLSAGIMPSDDQLAAMGMTKAQAQEYITAVQFEAALKSSGSSTKHSAAYDDAVKAAKTKGSPQAVDTYLGGLVSSGILTAEEADYIYRVILGYEYITPSKNPNAMTPDLKN